MSDSTASAIPGYWSLTASSSPSLFGRGAPGRCWPPLRGGIDPQLRRAPRPTPRSTPRICVHPTGGRCRAARRAGFRRYATWSRVEARDLDRREHLPRLHRGARASPRAGRSASRSSRRRGRRAMRWLLRVGPPGRSSRSPARRIAPPAATRPRQRRARAPAPGRSLALRLAATAILPDGSDAGGGQPWQPRPLDHLRALDRVLAENGSPRLIAVAASEPGCFDSYVVSARPATPPRGA